MDIQLKCACGNLQGVANIISKTRKIRGVCYCDDCQAYAHYLGCAPQVLDANGGTDVFPVEPANLEITAGVENLKCLRLSTVGMIRWYAGCCRTPIANTMPSIKYPFAGTVHTIMHHTISRDHDLGPVAAKMQGRFAIGTTSRDVYKRAPLSIIFRTIWFLIRGLIKGLNKPSPFFDSVTGKPKVEPYILSIAERENLRPFCGPTPTRFSILP